MTTPTVTLFTINTDISPDMEHEIYSIEVPEDQRGSTPILRTV